VTSATFAVRYVRSRTKCFSRNSVPILIIRTYRQIVEHVRNTIGNTRCDSKKDVVRFRIQIWRVNCKLRMDFYVLRVCLWPFGERRISIRGKYKLSSKTHTIELIAKLRPHWPNSNLAFTWIQSIPISLTFAYFGRFRNIDKKILNNVLAFTVFFIKIYVRFFQNTFFKNKTFFETTNI